jgi:Zn-dependent protease with chaperone function
LDCNTHHEKGENMNQTMSLQRRAVIAVVLTVGCYLMAVAIALGLLFIPYAEWTYGGRLHIKLALLCVVGGLAILWSVLPQGGAFTIPGPELKRDQEPELFAELEAIARAANQAMPAEVYLVPDLNAWVSQRGGFLGIGGRRIMGLGLPLMRVLKVPAWWNVFRADRTSCG